jgi:hypothetical protein
MTRDEARRRVRERRVLGFNEGDNLVEALEALGLLKLEGAESDNEKLSRALSIRGVDSELVFGAMASAGLKVVRA